MNHSGAPSLTSLGQGSAVLGFDVGGTDTKAALVDSTGDVRKIVRVPTPRDGERTADGVIAQVGEFARRLRERYTDVHPAAAGTSSARTCRR